MIDLEAMRKITLVVGQMEKVMFSCMLMRENACACEKGDVVSSCLCSKVF